MVTIPYIWIPWLQTGTHLQSHVDPQGFSHGLVKSLNNGVMPIFKASQSGASCGGTCATSLCERSCYMAREEVLWTKRVRPRQSVNAAVLGERPHMGHMPQHDPPPDLRKKKMEMMGLE